MNYLNTSKHWGQVGFVEGMGCAVNLRRLLKKVREIQKSKKNNFSILFVDFSNAYNTIKREVLYKRLKDKQILDDEEIEYLRQLHNRISIEHEGQKFHPRDGVHQGSPISPLLFDIAAEIISEKMAEFVETENDLFYADDLALILENIQLHRVIPALKKVAAEIGLKLNEKKSGIMNILTGRKKASTLSVIQDIPTVQEYKYLGILFGKNFSPISHYKKLDKKLWMIHSKVNWVIKNWQIDQRRLYFSALIRPHIEYILPIADLLDDNKGAKKLLRIWAKRSLNISSTMPNYVYDEISGNIANYIEENTRNVDWKIDQRSRKRFYNKPEMNTKIFESLSIIPDILIKSTNLLNWSTCKECKERMSAAHAIKHGIFSSDPYKQIIDIIKKISNNESNIQSENTIKIELLRSLISTDLAQAGGTDLDQIPPTEHEEIPNQQK